MSVGCERRTVCRRRCFAISHARRVFKKANPFAPVSARTFKVTPNPFFDNVQGIVNRGPPIRQLRSRSCRSTNRPKKETSFRRTHFPPVAGQTPGRSRPYRPYRPLRTLPLLRSHGYCPVFGVLGIGRPCDLVRHSCSR